MYAEKDDELWDAYDADRNLTGETLRRGDPVPEGRYHLVIHVCIFNKKNELLVQQRQPWKKGWPNMWDVSVGGSAVCGDDSRTAAMREVREELGISMDLTKMRPRFSINFPRGFDDFYLVEQEVDTDTLKLQEEEVRAARWVSREEALHMVDTGEMIPYFFLEQLFDMHSGYGTRYRYNPEICRAEEKHLISMQLLAEIVAAMNQNSNGADSENDQETCVKGLSDAVKNRQAFCCLLGNMVIGFLIYHEDGDTIKELLVHPEYSTLVFGCPKKTIAEHLKDCSEETADC